ncbi:ATP-dependent DNA helicase PIF1 [Trifolium repens]|nr:ATP-dependent DNA helicase PIF1 [Trifolium repens]
MFSFKVQSHNKRLKLTRNKYCVTADFLQNQFSASSSITTSEKHTNIQRTKLKCNENDQPLNTNSSTNLLSATVSPQLDGLCNPNLQERKPLSDITQSKLNHITTTSTNGFTAPSRKRGRPKKNQSSVQPNVPHFIEQPKQKMQNLNLQPTQCTTKTTFQHREVGNSYVPLYTSPILAPPLQRAGRPKKTTSVQETQAKSVRKESIKKKGITLHEIDEETVHCQPLQSSQCINQSDQDSEPLRTKKMRMTQAADTSVQSFISNATSLNSDTIVNSAQTQNSYPIIGTLPDLTHLKNHHIHKPIQFNKVGINLLSKFSEVGQNPNNPHLIDQTLQQQHEIHLDQEPSISAEQQTPQHNAFEPQSNHDFCSSDEDEDSDYNPFNYPESDQDYDSSGADDTVVNESSQTTTNSSYEDLGDQLIKCSFCGASMCSNNNIDPDIVQKLSDMLYEHNTQVKSFKMARDKINEGHVKNLKLRLIADRKTDGRIYNQPTVSEVAALIVGDIDQHDQRDIIIQSIGGELQRIDEFHASYLSYQYPLLFPYGEDGYRPKTAHRDQDDDDTEITEVNKRNRLTIREWLAYRIQNRTFEAKTLLSSRRLFQQFLVDGFTMLESERLQWLRGHQSQLRVAKYNNLNDQTQNNEDQANQQTDANSEEIRKFSEWILKVGEGKIAEPNDGLADITIPEELLISNFENPIQAIVDSTYPTLLHNYTNGDFLRCRAVLASTIEVVDEINEYVLNLIPGEEKEYLSADSIDRSEANDNDPFEQITPETRTNKQLKTAFHTIIYPDQVHIDIPISFKKMLVSNTQAT